MGRGHFSAYDLPTVELHNELYEFIQEQTNNTSEQAIETYFASKGLSLSKTWAKMNGGTVQSPYNITLLTYIGNSIHHPENTHNAPYTDVELQQSTSEMMRLIEAGL